MSWGSQAKTVWRWSPSFSMPRVMTSPGFKLRRGFFAHAHAWWGACGDEVSGLQCHEAAEVADELGHLNHGAGAAGLLAFPIHIQPHRQVLWITHLVGTDQPRTDGPEGVAALALVQVPPRSSWYARSEMSLMVQ